MAFKLDKNKPLSHVRDILPVMAVGKNEKDSPRLRKETVRIADENFKMNTILKKLKDGTFTESRVKSMAKAYPEEKHSVRAAIAKFKADKKKKETANKKETAKKKEDPLRNIRKGGEFPKKHGGKITYKMTGGQVVGASYD